MPEESIQLTTISELTAANDYPVPLADGIDEAELTKGDDDPMFVTLPIAEVGVKSRNDRTYPRSVVEQIVQQVNAHRPGGILGHMKDEERATRFSLPSLQWVGATLAESGIAYGKAYIPPGKPEVREYMQVRKRVRAPVATSIYGRGTSVRGVMKSVKLEGIDLADPNRAGVPSAIAVPHITSETIDEDKESTVDNEMLLEQYGNAQRKNVELENQIRDLQGQIDDQARQLKTFAELQAKADGDDVLAEFVANRKEVEALRKIAAAKAADDAIAEVDNEALRPYLAEMLGPVEDAEQATKRVAELLESESVKNLAKVLAVQAQGGKGAQGGQGQEKRGSVLEMTDDEMTEDWLKAAAEATSF